MSSIDFGEIEGTAPCRTYFEISIFTFLYFGTSCNQLTNICQWWYAQDFAFIDIISIYRLLESKSPHARKVLNSDKIVE